MDEQKKQKTNKILNTVVNVVVGIILVVALLVTINNVVSKKKGYTSLFGTAFMVVQSQSMEGDLPTEFVGQDVVKGFKKGDLLTVKILKGDDASKLKEGDIISFKIVTQDKSGHDVNIINSHRIVEINEDVPGQTRYRTQGDNRHTNPAPDDYWIYADDIMDNGLYCVIGVVKGNMGGIGRVFDFFNSSAGFLVCIVIPSFLVVIYFAFTLIREILRLNRAGVAEDKAKIEEEFLAKLRAQGVQIPADMSAPAETAPAEEPAKTESEEDNK